MKKISITAIVFGFLLQGALNCWAFKQEAPPSPVEAGETSSKQSDFAAMPVTGASGNIFVGHFGEILRFDDELMAEPEMQGPMEVVRFHERMRKTNKGVFVRFEPKAEDYAPENFTSLNLGQLFVIPKDVPIGFRSLAKLREAKEKELGLSGLGYEIQPVSVDSDYWPEDTFGVLISTPYRLYQLYSQSDKNIFIMTSGVAISAHPTGGSFSKTYESLREYLAQFEPQVAKEYLVYKYPAVAVPWATVLLLSSAIGFLPGRRGRIGQFRRMGRATLFFSAGLPLIGIFAIQFSRTHGFDKWLNMGSVPLGVAALLPFLCTALSSWLGGRRLRRTFMWIAGINLLPAFISATIAFTYFKGLESIDSREFIGVCSGLILLSCLDGAAFGLTHCDADEAAR